MDGKLHVYKRDDSRFWLCRYYAERKYKVKSTCEETLREARDFAEKWYLAIRDNQANDIPIHQKSFGVITDEYLVYQKILVKNYE